LPEAIKCVIAIKKIGLGGLWGRRSIGAELFSAIRALHKLIVTADLNKVSFFTAFVAGHYLTNINGSRLLPDIGCEKTK
jgi:hypothetical protein